MNEKELFIEKQRMRIWWVLLMLVTINFAFVFSLFNFSEQKIVVDADWGDLIIFFVLLLINLFMMSITLHTKITDRGIYLKFAPFHFKYIFFSWKNIKHAFIKTYTPLTEYGGWGWRYGEEGMAYNISGNIGLQIITMENKKFLIGTQKPEEIDTILKSKLKVN